MKAIKELVKEVYKSQLDNFDCPLIYIGVGADERIMMFDKVEDDNEIDLAIEKDRSEFARDVKIWASDNGYAINSGVREGKAFAVIVGKEMDEIIYGSMFQERKLVVEAGFKLLDVLKNKRSAK